MYGENPQQKCLRRGEPKLLVRAAEESFEDWDEWDGWGSSGLWDDLWDAFERDDEMAEPQPEYGDFWGEPDDEREWEI